jgi:hypothetical protein
MKRYLLCITIIGTVLFAGHSGAVTFTQNEFTTADSLDPGMTQSGIHFSLSSDYKSYYPAIRYGLGGLFEVGVKFGVVTNIKPDDKNGALLGADLKYQLIKQTEGVPLDMAVDLGFDNTIISGKNVSELKFSTIFSRSFALTDRGYKFIPYGGLQVSALYGSYLPMNDTNYYIFGGLEWKLSQKFMFLLELKTGATTVGGAGIRFEF